MRVAETINEMPRNGGPSIWLKWMLVAATMAIIFAASHSSNPLQHTAGFVEKVFGWLLRRASPEIFHAAVVVARKLAHVSEYALLAVLTYWASRPEPLRWNWRAARTAFVLCVLYAASDEWHQSFVPNRQPSSWDVLIDAGGALLGLAMVSAWIRWRKRVTAPL